MPKLIKASLVCALVGLFCTLPCLVRTTPGTMVLFFMAGIPLFAAAFMVYLFAVIQDLRSHKVL